MQTKTEKKLHQVMLEILEETHDEQEMVNNLYIIMRGVNDFTHQATLGSFAHGLRNKLRNQIGHTFDIISETSVVTNCTCTECILKHQL
jgi:hypothetical protein